MIKYISVSQLNNQIKTLLSHTFINVRVRGEISSITHHQNGNSYFVLKDENASIRCVLFRGNKTRLNLKLEANMNVDIEGSINVYEQRGEYQIICANVVESGVGEMALKYEKLKKELYEKGYFESKKPLPPFPKKIALLTSKNGAVLHDMLSVCQKRWPLIELTLIHTAVQGREAKYEIEQNIKLASCMDFDIIVLARGGGSLEDLWCFNEEIVATAIFESNTPIVSAIGHEIDYTLSDFVADLRAPTPSACMELILPDINEWLLKINDIELNLENMHGAFLERLNNKLIESRNLLSMYKIDFEGSYFAIRELINILENLVLKLSAKKEGEIQNLVYLMNQIYTMQIPLREQIIEGLNLDLHNFARIFLQNKINEFRSLKSTIENNNFKKIIESGYVQILKDNKPIKLKHLSLNEKIILSDCETKKEALILN